VPCNGDYHHSDSRYSLDRGGTVLSEIPSLVLLSIFIGGIALLALTKSMGVSSSVRGRIRSASLSPIALADFLKIDSQATRKNYLFKEEKVISLTHRYTGRFDAAVLRFKEVAILEAMIERKYPTKYLPTKAREQDLFQASLYALALQDSGVSCTSTRLVIIYCLQRNAMQCQNRSIADCLTCRHARVMVDRFRPSRTISQLRNMDDYWFRRRPPKPNATKNSCRICPFNKNGKCQYSVV
jgi:hypothetical protein